MDSIESLYYVLAPSFSTDFSPIFEPNIKANKNFVCSFIS